MELMELIPNEPKQSFNELIVHTKYNCILPQDDDEIKNLFKQRGLKNRIHIWFRRQCILSRTHPYTKIHLKSDNVIKYEIMKHITLYPHMIHPNSAFRQFWEVFQIIFTFIALMVIPFLNSFYIEEHHSWMYILLIVNLVFICDMILSFLTGFIDKYTQHVILDSKLVISNYLKGLFIVDFMSSFPSEIVDILNHNETMIATLYCSVFNSFTFLRIINFFKYAKNIQYRYRISLKAYKIFEIIILIILSIHWAACLQYYIPLVIKYSDIDSDYEEISWIYSETMKKRHTVLQKYIMCLNRAIISLVCSTHFLNVSAWEDIILNVILSFIGKGGFIYILAQTMYMMSTYGTENVHAKQKHQLKEYSRYKKLPKKITKRLLIYNNYTSRNHFGSDKNIFYGLPPKLCEVITL